ncbi:MAG TPA: MerR family transcriptional regulator [Verrucomicrobiae bacterium]|nr:MerR family transcriptional regulator [Verrucomicrobiae bacterium]
MSDLRHEIKAVAKRTGLSPHVIRVWEKRYGVVKPVRTETNRRLYSDAEIERLELLHQATRLGHNISQAAKLSMEKLRELVATPASPRVVGPEATESAQADAKLVNECLRDVRDLDAPALDRALERGMVRLGHMGFLNRIAGPLCQRVGDLWRTGELTAAHEHFLSAALRTFLGQSTRQFPQPESAPCLVVATPAGQLHELGAVMVAAAASNLGWRVTYLGTSLPAAEIAGVATQNKARAVALSLVYPEDDAGLGEELAKLRRYLPADIKIIAGGRAAEAYRDPLSRIGALRIADLIGLMTTLDDLRKRNGHG